MLPNNDHRPMDCRSRQRRNRAPPDPNSTDLDRRNSRLQKFRMDKIRRATILHFLARHHDSNLAFSLACGWSRTSCAATIHLDRNRHDNHHRRRRIFKNYFLRANENFQIKFIQAAALFVLTALAQYIAMSCKPTASAIPEAADQLDDLVQGAASAVPQRNLRTLVLTA